MTAGLHGIDTADTKIVTVTLAPGTHVFRLDYFQGPGDVGLILLMSTTTAAAAQPISPSALSHSAVRNLTAGHIWPFAVHLHISCRLLIPLPAPDIRQLPRSISSCCLAQHESHSQQQL